MCAIFFLLIARVLSMISLARCPAWTMLFKLAVPLPTSGVSLASQRKAALAFATMAANGCLISWATEADKMAASA